MSAAQSLYRVQLTYSREYEVEVTHDEGDEDGAREAAEALPLGALKVAGPGETSAWDCEELGPAPVVAAADALTLGSLPLDAKAVAQVEALETALEAFGEVDALVAALGKRARETAEDIRADHEHLDSWEETVEFFLGEARVLDACARTLRH